MKNKKLKILDCTLRDGGYYNNWDFSNELVNEYISTIKKSPVDVIEIGFKNIDSLNFKGPFYYSTDDYINNLNLPKNKKYAVMINCDNFIDKNFYKLKLILKPSNKTLISIIRIAVNFDKYKNAKKIVNYIKDLKYDVGLNLMQAHNKTDKKYTEIVRDIKSWNMVDILYFADSIGNMNPIEVRKICNIFIKNWNKSLGFHAHNNKGLALSNTLEAINAGFDWVDSTINGMGRGAGNVETESLLMELSNIKKISFFPDQFYNLVNVFLKLKSEFNWGPNMLYHYAAVNNIHPTFVQELINDKRYSTNQLFDILKLLSKKNSLSFNYDLITDVVYKKKKKSYGSWNATNWLNKKDVMVIGAGDSVNKYKKDIITYIKKYKPVVIFLNINKFIPSSFGDATIVCHDKRILYESHLYKKLKHPLIMPLDNYETLINNHIKKLTIYDYGLNLSSNKFIINNSYCTLPSPLVTAYSLAVLTKANANKIFLVGFDGYSKSEILNDEMNRIFKSYNSLKNKKEIISLTPTKYDINESSIFKYL